MGGSERIASAGIPQADSLELVVRLVRAVAANEADPGAGLGLHARQVAYYTNAGIILGLLDDDGVALPRGIELAQASDDDVPRVLAEAFGASSLGRRLLRFAKVDSLDAVPLDKVRPFLEAHSDLGASTARRRATSIRQWLAYLRTPGDTVKRPADMTPGAPPSAPPAPPAPPAPSAPPSTPPHARREATVLPTVEQPIVAAGPVTTALLAHADASVRERLERLAPQGDVDVAALRRALRAHVAEGERRQADNEFLDLGLCRKLAEVGEQLLDLMPLLDGDMQAAIVVAVRYFCQTNDEEDDFSSAIGFDDDADVMRQLLTQLGRMDLWNEP
jgi:hypothetical protein